MADSSTVPPVVLGIYYWGGELVETNHYLGARISLILATIVSLGFKDGLVSASHADVCVIGSEVTLLNNTGKSADVN